MKAQEITVEVEVKLTVSESTAEMCAKLLEMYLNDNHDKSLQTCVKNGKLSILIKDASWAKTKGVIQV